jgi:xanthine/CO dehydrogenase XdhC/CoxF family maturation factor
VREILPALERWYAARTPFGLATVVAVSRSAPRGPGAAMAVGPDDEVVGSVSGGCVEGAVFELAQEVVASGEARLETFGYSDEDAFAVGLTCGGEITVLVRPVTSGSDPAFGPVAASVTAGEPVTLATGIPAVRSRSSGSGSACRGGAGSVSSGRPASSAAAGARSVSRCARHVANWLTSRSPTSASTPRPNCAGRPVTVRSVRTDTAVPPSRSLSAAVIVALAVPCPRVSRPLATSTIRCADPSCSSKTAVPR